MDAILHALTSSIFFLPACSKLNLASTCKNMFSLLSSIINTELNFRYPGGDRAFVWHKPQKLKVGGFFGCTFEHPPSLSPNFSFNILLLPPSLSQLSFGQYFDQPVGNLLPASLTNLSFGDCFNYPVDTLPPNLLYLHVGAYFNQLIDSLPSSLTYLDLGEQFDQSIDSLPSTLISLKLLESKEGYSPSFDQSVSHFPPKLATFHIQIDTFDFIHLLPNSITDLQFQHCSNLMFPPNLTRLSFWPDHSRDDVLKLPSTLSFLSIFSGDQDAAVMIPSLPPNLKELYADGNYHFTNLPSSLTHVMLPWNFLKEGDRLTSSLLPPNLTHLILPFNFKGEIHLTTTPQVSFKSNSSRQVDIFSLPLTLKKLKISAVYPSFNLPPQLEELKVKNHLRDFQSAFPSTLRKLYLGVTYEPALTSLPFHLEKLSVYSELKGQPLPPLPSSLRVLHIPFVNALPPSFPSSITSLNVKLKKGDILPPLPPYLKHLAINTYPLIDIPLTIESLSIGKYSTHIENTDCFMKVFQ